MQPPTPTQPPGPHSPYQYPYPPQPPGGAPSPYYPQPQPLPPPRRSRNLLLLVIVIVVVVVVVGVVIGLAEFKSASLTVTVSSNHVTNTVTYILDLDGQQVNSGVLSPLQSVQVPVPVTWWGDSCTYHTVSATSTGGGLGPESDSSSGLLCSGQSYTASLSI